MESGLSKVINVPELRTQLLRMEPEDIMALCLTEKNVMTICNDAHFWKEKYRLDVSHKMYWVVTSTEHNESVNDDDPVVCKYIGLYKTYDRAIKGIIKSIDDNLSFSFGREAVRELMKSVNSSILSNEVRPIHYDLIEEEQLTTVIIHLYYTKSKKRSKPTRVVLIELPGLEQSIEFLIHESIPK